MAELYAEVAALGSARRDITDIAQTLATERRNLSARIEGLLASGWRGSAANSFSAAWQEWCEGADQVSDGLHKLSEAMQETLVDIRRTDSAGASTMARATHDVTPMTRAASRLSGRGSL